MNREKREIPFLEIFSQTSKEYHEMIENKEKRKKIISFLNNSEKRRRITCWGRIRWESPERGEWKAGKEWENVLAEIFEMRKFFSENSKIWLADPQDDKEGRDLLVYINKEKDLLLAIDLTLNGDEKVLNGKFSHSYYDNPVELKKPPNIRENNPKALKFVLALPKIAGLETMNRFFQILEKNENLKNLKEDQIFQKDEVISAVLSEFLKQIELQLENFSKKNIIADLYRKEIVQLRKIISDQKEIFQKELTPESKRIENYLEEGKIGGIIRKFFEKT